MPVPVSLGNSATGDWIYNKSVGEFRVFFIKFFLTFDTLLPDWTKPLKH